MDERAFVERRRPEWERLAELLRRVSSSGGLKSLSGPELADIGKLYRRVTSDLAHVTANSANDELIRYLNELAGRAHGCLFADAPSGGIRSAYSFLLRGFPILFRAKSRFIALAAGICLMSAVVAGVIAAQSPDSAKSLLPPTFQNISPPKGRGPVRPDPHGVPIPATVSTAIMVNNIWVSLLAFVGGLPFGLLTVQALVENGKMLGALAVLFSPNKQWALQFWSLILPHGIIELTAIFIAGGAGLMLGWSLIRPKNLTRWDSLRKVAREAVLLMAGVVPMLIIAACIEGFITPSGLPREAKFGFAGLTGIGLILYFTLAGRRMIRNT